MMADWMANKLGRETKLNKGAVRPYSVPSHASSVGLPGVLVCRASDTGGSVPFPSRRRRTMPLNSRKWLVMFFCTADRQSLRCR